MERYEDIEIKRVYSKYPTGLKHYSTEKLFESSLFDIALVRYKLASLVKGQNDEVVRKHRRKNGRTSR